MATINKYEYQRTDVSLMDQGYFNSEVDFEQLNRLLIPFKRVGIIVPIVEDKRMAVDHMGAIQTRLPNTDFKHARVIGGGSAASSIAISDASRLVDSGICEAVLVTSWYNNNKDQAGWFWCILTRNKRGFAKIAMVVDEFELADDPRYGTYDGYRKLLQPMRYMNISHVVGHMNGGTNDKCESEAYDHYFEDKDFKLVSKKNTDGEVGHLDSAIELLETIDECLGMSAGSAGIMSINYGYGGFYNAIYVKLTSVLR